MSKTVTVHVTADHIERGSTSSPSNCPIALALRERFPRARVFGSTWTNDHLILRYGSLPLSSRARYFINTFDHRGPHAVQPSTFRLPLPEVTA